MKLGKKTIIVIILSAVGVIGFLAIFGTTGDKTALAVGSIVMFMVGLILIATDDTFDTKIKDGDTEPSPNTPQKQPAHSTAEECSQSSPVSVDHSVSASTPQGNKKTYKFTGMEHRLDNLLSLSCENDDYKASKKEIIEFGMENQRIQEREFYPAKIDLIPEPDNPFDPNAIKVVVDEQHVGYIKRGSCAHLLKLLRENRVGKISGEIKGGRYKIVVEDEDDSGNSKYYIEKSEAPYSIHLKIEEKE